MAFTTMPPPNLTSLLILLTWLPLLLAMPQSLPYIAPNDDSSRIIPTLMENPDTGGTHNQSTQLCATPPPPYHLRATLGQLQLARTHEKRGFDEEASGLRKLGLQKRDAPSATQNIQVETFFHIVTTRKMARYFTATVRKNIISNQVVALNTAYRPSGISFHMNPSTFTIKDEWATDLQSTNMKKALRKGNYSALNIWFQSNLTSNPAAGTSGGSGAANTLLGYCTLPTTITYDYGGQTYEYPKEDYATDGCNILAASMPGSPMAVYGYDRGKTAVHEVGHWFGLLHTFQDNSCQPTSQGDYVDDTPQESTSTVGCPKGKDTCPLARGLDPITNYMDYSIDECYTNFSPDQQQRMRDMWTMYRKGY